ncbi:MAG: alpha/beta fold hydrolase [Sphingopyxis sp.]|nr:alpha/beta fold hydrolase [Sphingopyxis sp.]
MWLDEGGNDAPPLLFLNGIAADNRLAGALLSRIGGRTRITLDMPGIGGAPDRLYPYSIADVAIAVANAMEQLGHDRFDVAGFSWGGAVAQQLALADNTPLRRMVLMATSPLLPAPGLCVGTLFDADVLTSGVRLTGTSLIGIGAQLIAANGWSVVSMLPRLTDVPTLILGARGDMVVPIAYAQWLARLIPGAQLEIVDGAHLFAFRQSERIGGMIAAFLDAD